MLQLPVSKTRRRMTRSNPAKVFPPLGQATQATPSVSVKKLGWGVGGRHKTMMTLVVHVRDCIRKTLRRKMALNGWSAHFFECITQHAKKKSWKNSTSCVMVVSILTTVNNHTICIYTYIQNDNIDNL